jgi:hypothetical protein
LSNNDTDSKKIVDYNITENQFVIEYTVLFHDGTSDYFIESKDKKYEKFPTWVNDIKGFNRKSNYNK